MDDTTTVYVHTSSDKSIQPRADRLWVKVGIHEDLKNLEMCVLSRLSETR